MSEAQTKASNKYNKEKTTGIFIRLNNKTDAKIIKHLEGVRNKTDYIRVLILQDMNKY